MIFFSGWKGDRCDEKIDVCKEKSIQCQNEGKCVTVGDTYVCQCPPTKMGDLCEEGNE